MSACNAGDKGLMPGSDPWVGKIPLEKEMATYSSTLAWKIPWMEEPGRIHGIAKSRTRLSNFTWRRKWLLTPIFLPGESHGQRSLVGYGPWSLKELDMIERLSLPSLLHYPVHGALSCENLCRVINTKICLFSIFFLLI